MIEVQKSVFVDKTGKKVKTAGEKAAGVSTEKANMVRIGEGEVSWSLLPLKSAELTVSSQ